MSRLYTKNQYDQDKSNIMRRLIPHMMSPDRFPAPKMTLDDIAILQSENSSTVKSKMSVCKAKYDALRAMKSIMKRIGIKSACDFLGNSAPLPARTYGIT